MKNRFTAHTAPEVSSVMDDVWGGEPNAVAHAQIFKLIVIGDSNVGKTCLTFRFCGGRFLDRVETTIGVDFFEKTVLVDNEPVKLQVWDTAGQERFRRSMVKHYYRNVHAVIFVYDVTRMSSFENLTHWISECKLNSMYTSTHKVLIGNKNDMNEWKSVSTSMAQKFADFHEMDFYETSAKDDAEEEHISEIFVHIAECIYATSIKSYSSFRSGAENQTIPVSLAAKAEPQSGPKSTCCK